MATTATKLYNIQNKSIHMAMGAAGYPYNSNKEMWLPLLVKIVGKRKITGLSSLSLGERSQLIKHFKAQGHDVFSPWIPKGFWYWKKGDKDKATSFGRPLAVAEDKESLLKKIGAILADQRLPWSYTDGIARKRFGIDKTEWLTPEQLKKVMQMMIIYQRRQEKKTTKGA